jgi:hypothetical protein
MDSLFHFLSNLVLFLTLTTLVFALGAYGALALRRRKPLGRRREQLFDGEAVLLRRYMPREKE